MKEKNVGSRGVTSTKVKVYSSPEGAATPYHTETNLEKDETTSELGYLVVWHTQDRSASIMGSGIPCTRCVSHTVYLAHEDNKGEARGRSRHKKNSKRFVRNLEERNEGTKFYQYIRGLKQSLVAAKKFEKTEIQGSI